MLTTNPKHTGNLANTDLLRSPLFTSWKDPVSGVESFLLSRRVAPLQQSFYFVNPSLTDDGRYYWFYCSFPPGGNANYGRSLAVADLWENRIHHYPETLFLDASPLVDLSTGEVYWCTGSEVWKRGPKPEDQPVFINRFPVELANNRRLWRLSTHLTFSADRTALNFDAEVGLEWFVGHIPLDGGEVVVWQKFDRCYNHGQFSPTDPDLQLIAQDNFVHPLTGEINSLANRLWLIRRNEKARPVYSREIPMKSEVFVQNGHYENERPSRVHDERIMHGHEWWSADGQYIWYVHYGVGVERIPAYGAPVADLIWPLNHVSHGHADESGKLVVVDCLPPDRPEEGRVAFYNRETGRKINIVSLIPYPDDRQQSYHVHAHPQFCGGDRYICYTTTVLGGIDVAFTLVDELVDKTS
ncbi:MAG: hypothetical protein WC205_13450 [Opitutaceae bacterium]|jgi:hypothetical protein